MNKPKNDYFSVISFISIIITLISTLYLILILFFGMELHLFLNKTFQNMIHLYELYIFISPLAFICLMMQIYGYFKFKNIHYIWLMFVFSMIHITISYFWFREVVQMF